MARPEKNNVAYFPHPTRHGKKMSYIKKTYGNDGYSLWFILLEHLGEADFHYLDLSDEIGLMYLSSDLNMTDDEIFIIINDLVKLGEFDADLWNNEKIVFSEKFIDTIRDAYKKRSTDPLNKVELIGLLERKGTIKKGKLPIHATGNEVKETINTQRKEEKIKEKESIEDKSGDSGFDFDSKTPERVITATEKICAFFGINENRQPKHFMAIGSFVRTIHFQGDSSFDWLSEQFSYYQKVKSIEKGFKHSWQNFIGSKEEGYDDGAWNKENWREKWNEKKDSDKKENSDKKTIDWNQID
jgi:hypothetical protein